MGLDMYLFKNQDRENPICYWRKANAIRGWLVKHGAIEDDDDGVIREIDRELIHELIADCEKVVEKFKIAALEKTDNAAKDFFETAKKTLPPTEGFFFGGTDIDQYYVEEILETIDKLTTVLETTTDDDEVFYEDSW